MGARTGFLASELDPQRKLGEPGIGAGRYDPSEIAGLKYATRVGIDDAAGRIHSIQVADRVGEIGMVEQIEEFGAELHPPRFPQVKALHGCTEHRRFKRGTATMAAPFRGFRDVV